MQTTYATTATRNAATASGNGTVAALCASQLGELGEQRVNAQFSQSQESAADNFSFDQLTERNLPREGLVTAFEKLAKLSGGESCMFDSHPSSAERADNMRNRLAAK